MRCLLVDDERLARNNLRALLKAHPELTIVGEASDSQQAEEAIRRFKPDLVFLDIQLNDGNGFDLLERLDPAPRIIFVTAHDRFAVRAFEVNPSSSVSGAKKVIS
jgi:two-component system LytT family response regulator